MPSESTARTGAQTSTFVRNTEESDAPTVEVTFPIRTVTLDQIDDFCRVCEPGEMTRGLALRLIVETGIQFWNASAEANQPEETTLPFRASAMNRLDEASIPEILLYGLVLPEDDDPVLGVFQGVRRELGVIAALAEHEQATTVVEVLELDAVLESILHRVELGIELYTRARRARSSGKPLESASPAEAEPSEVPEAPPSEQEHASSPHSGRQGS